MANGLLIGKGAGATGTNTSLTPALTTNAYAAGDTIIAIFAARGAGSVATPSGWTAATGSPYNNATSGVNKLWVFSKAAASSSETAPTLVYTGGSANDTVLAQTLIVRGATTISAAGTVFTGASAQNIGPITGLNVTANQAVLVIGHKADDWTSVATLTGDLGWAEIGEVFSTLGNDAGLVWDIAIARSSLTVGSKTFTVTGGASNTSVGVMLALDAPAVWNTELSPLDKASTAVLSNNNLTLGASGSGQSTARASRALPAGKWGFEVNIDATNSVFETMVVGLMSNKGAAGNYNFLDSGGQSGGWWYSDGIWTGNNDVQQTSGYPDETVGTKIRIAADTTTPGSEKFWVAVGAGNWNNSPSADPATGVGGFSIASWDNYFPYGSLGNTAGVMTFNFGASAFTYSLPSGFSGLDTNVSTGAASFTEDADTSSATGAVKVQAAASPSEAADTTTAAGAVKVQAAGAAQEADDTLAAAGGARPATGDASLSEADDTVAAAGAVKVQAAASVSEADDTTGAAGAVKVQGAGAAGEADDTATAAGVVEVQGAAAASDADDTLAGQGTVPVRGDAAAAEGDDTVAAAGLVKVQGAAAVADADDTLNAIGSGTVTTVGDLNVVEDNDTATATAAVKVQAAATLIEADDGLAATGGVRVTGAGAAGEDPDALSAAAAVKLRGDGDLIEDPDAAASAGRVRIGGDAEVGEADDTLAATVAPQIVVVVNPALVRKISGASSVATILGAGSAAKIVGQGTRGRI
ncbi:MAG TPA: hypothetical protein VL358_04525 [Caulobacteraceae bacterium]|jgi:hypothetical protein|nr:hypothetical protein [Caulobacteraceae bacterium]